LKKSGRTLKALSNRAAFAYKTYSVRSYKNGLSSQKSSRLVQSAHEIDHPAIEEPTMPKTYLAHLGLARAYALEGRNADSRKEYEVLFNLWKDADTDIPVPRQAHPEYDRLASAANTR